VLAFESTLTEDMDSGGFLPKGPLWQHYPRLGGRKRQIHMSRSVALYFFDFCWFARRARAKF
jgi:hypothetical protein